MASSIQYRVNCGFARVAIRQFSEVGKGKQDSDANTERREYKFINLFSSVPSYGIQSTMFDEQGHRESLFTRQCKNINGIFSKWSGRDKKAKYIDTFSVENWEKLSAYNKRRHTLSNCKECFLQYKEHQETFPGPVYQPTITLAMNVKTLVENNSSMNVPMATTTQQILSEIEPVYQGAYGHSFTESLTKYPKSGIQIKTTDAQRKKLNGRYK